MSRNKKPRKAYRPRPITPDTMALARSNAAKPAGADRAEIFDTLREAVKALREGMATEQQWAIAAGTVALALAIERQGIFRGLIEHITTCGKALAAIHDRAMRNGGGKWVRVTLYFNEIDALNDLVWFHKLQTDQLGRAEFLAAVDVAQKQTIQEGHTVTVARNLERLAA